MEQESVSAKRVHDLNQPLNAIKMIAGGILYMLNQGKQLPEEELARCMKEIAAQTDRVAEMLAALRGTNKESQSNEDTACR